MACIHITNEAGVEITTESGVQIVTDDSDCSQEDFVPRIYVDRPQYQSAANRLHYRSAEGHLHYVSDREL